MTVTLIFSLPDERSDLHAALRATTWLSTLQDIDQIARGRLKHGGDPREALATIRTAIADSGVWIDDSLL